MTRLLLLLLLACVIGRGGADLPDDPEVVRSREGEVSAPWRLVQEATLEVLPPPLKAALSHPTHTPVQPHLHHHAQAEETTREGSASDHLLDIYLPSINTSSPQCSQEVQAFLLALATKENWAIKMIDSWGKFPDGILAGNTWVPGLMDECMDQRAYHSKGNFKGQYCTISYKKAPAEGKSEDDAGKEDDQRVRPYLSIRMAGIAGMLGHAIPSGLYSTCIPSSCTKDELRDSVEQHLSHYNLTIQTLGCQTDDPLTLEYNARDITMIVVMSLLGALVLVGTSYDLWLAYTGRKHPSEGALRYILVFSFHTNLEKIFKINVNEGKQVISCLHGIRVLSMTWVTFGHTYIMSNYNAANKFLLTERVGEHLVGMQVILNGLPSVDTFFLVSGLLVAYNLTKDFERKKKITAFQMVHFYVHRIIRLSPPILLLSGIFAVFPPVLIRGAQSPTMTDPGSIVDLCRRYWWRDAFFLTNWFFGFMDTESCVPVCWYTAVDFQLYIATPLLFFPILFNRKWGSMWMGVLLVASCVIPGTVIAVNNLPPTQVQDISLSDYRVYTKWNYTKPWCRASPYLVGMCLGYFFAINKGEKIKMKLWQVLLGWGVALGAGYGVVYGIPEYNTYTFGPHPYVPAISILYGSFSRLAWGVVVGWVVFVCHMGYGGPVNSFLAHPSWQPLSRLTYCIFLVALNFQYLLYLYIVRLPSYFTNFNKVMETVATLFISGIFGLLLSLLAEAPILGLEKLVLKRGAPRKTTPSSTIVLADPDSKDKGEEAELEIEDPVIANLDTIHLTLRPDHTEC